MHPKYMEKMRLLINATKARSGGIQLLHLAGEFLDLRFSFRHLCGLSLLVLLPQRHQAAGVKGEGLDLVAVWCFWAKKMKSLPFTVISIPYAKRLGLWTRNFHNNISINRHTLFSNRVDSWKKNPAPLGMPQKVLILV